MSGFRSIFILPGWELILERVTHPVIGGAWHSICSSCLPLLVLLMGFKTDQSTFAYVLRTLKKVVVVVMQFVLY